MAQTKSNKVELDPVIEARVRELERRVCERAFEGRSPDQLSEDEKEVLDRMMDMSVDERSDPLFTPWEFDSTWVRFVSQEPFFATFLLSLQRRSNYKIPTAGMAVHLSDQRHMPEFTLFLNPSWFRKLPEDQRTGILIHEIYHYFLNHVTSRRPSDPNEFHLWNLATDMAINSLIGKRRLPEKIIYPGQMPVLDPNRATPLAIAIAGAIAKATPGESSDLYFEDLKRVVKDQQGDGNGGGESNIEIELTEAGLAPGDDHSGWDNLPEEVKEQVENKLRDLMRSAAEQAMRTQNWGSVSHEMQALIQRYLSREVSWERVLRSFAGRCRTTERKSSIKKYNKKLPYMFPGAFRKVRPRMVAFIDQSGSMADEDVAMVLNELSGLAKFVAIDIYPFDTSVDENGHIVWKPGMPFPTFKRTRCGGTDFACIARFCNRRENRGKWGGVLVETDGYAEGLPLIHGAKVLWLITPEGTLGPVRQGDLAVKLTRNSNEKKDFVRF
jgi:predicted metal-dependent peptidase